MKPIFQIGNRDWAPYIAELKPSRNDLDKDGSGRNILDGLMHRTRIAQKAKYSVSFNRLDENEMALLRSDMDPQYVSIKLLDPATNTQTWKTYYTSTINDGIQHYMPTEGKTVYDGVAFDITQR